MNSTAAQSKIKLRADLRRSLADTLTPVSIYLKVRDHYRQSVLLESNDFRSAENCFSYIGLEPIATFEVFNGLIRRELPDGSLQESPATSPDDVPEQFAAFLGLFEPDESLPARVLNGLFGFSGFEAVQYFDRFSVDLSRGQSDLPDLHYSLFRYVIGIDHFKEELYLLENLLEGETSSLDRLESLLQNQTVATYPFELRGAEQSNLTDEEFMELVRIGKQHCLRGDVFQIVFSRQFRQEYLGDDFNVYRILRSVNPSPYLFYFDFGSYRIFGSSPEAQLVIRQGVASVNPIAGTYRRTGDDEADRQEAEALAADPKERAEHIMLVDLARNDLGRHATGVQVRELMEIQYFSHVIHLVSKVEGRLAADNNPIRVFGDTFPAGTLSGAPKYRAIELIHQYENQARTFYGGAIGYIGFHGEMNQAIVIRSFLSRNNVLLYQAGAGIVAASVEERELQEVNNKLGALKKALLEAEQIKA